MSEDKKTELKGVEKVMVVEGWNQHVYRSALKVNLLLAASVLCLMPIAFIGVTKKPETVYFATNEHGGLTQLIPLNEPNLSDTAITQWAVNAITESYTMDYVNFKTQIAKSGRDYFTDQGLEQFKNAIRDSGNLDALLSRRMIISTIVTSTPIINSKGLNRGVFTWQIDVPVRVTYQNGDSQATQELGVKLLVTRESLLEKRYGVGITQFITASRR